MPNEERIVFHNRDIKVKISLINHVQYFLDFNGIDETVIRLLPTEFIDKKFSNLRMDFLVECESGNIYLIEGETSSVDNDTMDKIWKYVKELICKYENDIYGIIIALSKNNKSALKEMGSIKFQPLLCEMKKFNGDEYLNKIKNKFKSKKELTIEDCAVIENIPDMKNSQREEIVVEQLCEIIKDGIISDENRIRLQATMWLNIDYYVKDSEKRKDLMEMIKVEESQDEEFFKWQDEYGEFRENKGREEGIEEGREEERNKFIGILLDSMTPEEISEKFSIPLKDIK